MRIKIANIPVSYKNNVFVIAEAGVNHNGRLDLALKLIDVASKAGADAIKFQTFKAKEVVIENAEMADYQKKNIKKSQSQQNMLKKLELKEKFYLPIIKHCRKRKIIFLSTPHGGFASVDFLIRLKVPALKFGSGDLTNLPLLKYASRFKIPIIISTGMSNLNEVKEAINIIKKAGNNQLIALHATTNYPCPYNEVNLSAMKTMIDSLNVLVGYSDHTLGIQTAIMAATMGACLIEKHFTLARDLPGPDHRASCEPDELSDMIKGVQLAKTILGSAIKKPNKGELPMIQQVRKSVVSLTSIKKGGKFTNKNIGVKRPGYGLKPIYYEKLIGKTAKQNILSDTLIKKEHYAK